MIFHLTDAGRALLADSVNDGSPVYGVRFVRAEFGNGASQDPAAATALNNPLLTGLFNSKEVTDNSLKMVATITNSSLNVGFDLTEAGYFAGKQIDDEDPTDVVLFAIGYDAPGDATRIQSKFESVISFDFEFDLYFSDSENINAILNENASYASDTEFQKHLTDYGNPHNVNAAQVGLDRVPNVYTNDQTPTFTEETVLKLLDGSEEDGDTLSELFGKLAKGQHDFKDHRDDKNNPHEVTAEQIGAAKAGHTHHTNDINKGVLPIARGGTGLSAGAKEVASDGYTCRIVTELPGGLLIQAGALKKEKYSYNVDVAFSRPYKNENYLLYITGCYGDIDNPGSNRIDPAWYMPKKTKTGFTTRSAANLVSEWADWFAIGFAENPS